MSKRLFTLFCLVCILVQTVGCASSKVTETANNSQKETAMPTMEQVVEVTPSLPDPTPTPLPEYPGMREITTMELVREMGLGINLGNTFESCGDWIKKWGDGTVASYETAWGSPIITQEMIEGYRKAGFGVLRIPVAWSNMADDNYNLSPEYLAAVKQVVDWTLDSGMYAIINIHHDNGWMADFPNNPEGCMTRYEKIWTQVADYFKDYDDRLMFESLNEEACWEDVWNKWKGSNEGKDVVFGLCNSINQKFVDVVRSSGGNNPKRHLLIAGYSTNIDMCCDKLFQMPNDPENRMALSIHYYTPSTFAILTEDASWGENQTTWGTEQDVKDLINNLNKLEKNYISKNIPVIMGEYGCPTQNKDMNSVYKFLTTVCKEAYDRQICPIMWDTTDRMYSRENAKLIYPELEEAFKAIYNGEAIPEVSMDKYKQ